MLLAFKVGGEIPLRIGWDVAIEAKEAGVMIATRGKHPKEKGQGLVEYALVILLVAVAVVGALTLFGTSVNSMFTAIAPSI